MTALTSIIIPVKNGSNYLAEALEAIKLQNVNTEIIVVDDASNDNSAEIAKYFGCIVLKHQTCKGPVIAKNTALKVASGKYIMFHDHDDIMREDSLAKMISEIEKDELFFAVMAQLQDFFCPKLSAQESAKLALKSEPYFGLFSGAILMKKEIFNIIKPFEENIQAGEILDWTNKMSLHNLPIKRLNFIATKRRIHNSNFGRTNKDAEYKDYAAILRSRIKK